LKPDLQIDWLAQDPVTRLLEGAGERIHPASEHLANESGHIESESAEHDLHCFQAWRRMDEILIANFMVFHDLVREDAYDLWIADEGWEIDYYLHENPKEKQAPYVWLTDFVGCSKLRAELGYAPDEKVCIVTVGGSGVGGHLLRRVIASFPEAKARVPELRMIVVAGPRIDPETLPSVDGLEVRAYVHDLYRHLAACDLAVVQGGLTTSMELTANKRPFLYFPLRHHFEQNFHVRHRLTRS